VSSVALDFDSVAEKVDGAVMVFIDATVFGKVSLLKTSPLGPSAYFQEILAQF
jgi:hypothetical protein